MRVFASIVIVTVRLAIVLVVLVIVIVIAMPVLMRVLDAVEMFVHVQVESVSIVVGVHHSSFRYFTSAALSSREPAAKRHTRIKHASVSAGRVVWATILPAS